VPHPAASRCSSVLCHCSSVTHGIGSVTDTPQLSNAFNIVDDVCVRVGTVKPSITEMGNITEREGRRVVINCRARGDPAPTMTFQKNDQEPFKLGDNVSASSRSLTVSRYFVIFGRQARGWYVVLLSRRGKRCCTERPVKHGDVTRATT